MLLRFTFYITILHFLNKLPSLNGKLSILSSNILNLQPFDDYIRNFVSAKSSDLVSCGSVLKLFNVDYKIRLHSHDVKYGSGSGQQSVTGITISEDLNSHWTVKAPTGQHCNRGYKIF